MSSGNFCLVHGERSEWPDQKVKSQDRMFIKVCECVHRRQEEGDMREWDVTCFL